MTNLALHFPELNANQLAMLQRLMLEVISDDELEKAPRTNWNTAQNMLRAEQRQRLQALLGNKLKDLL